MMLGLDERAKKQQCLAFQEGRLFLFLFLGMFFYSFCVFLAFSKRVAFGNCLVFCQRPKIGLLRR